jgi:hypothetical protein
LQVVMCDILTVITLICLINHMRGAILWELEEKGH